MLQLFNKTIEPLNQFVKKKIKKKSVFRGAADICLTIFDNTFSQNSFFCQKKVFMNSTFMQSIRKRNKQCWINSREIAAIFTEKSSRYRVEI